MLSKDFDFDVELRKKECKILKKNFMGGDKIVKRILFLFGTTGTGKTSLVEYYLNTTIRTKHRNIKSYYYNIIRTRSERLVQLMPVLNSKIKEKHFVVLDEVDKADSQLMLRAIRNLLELSFENENLNFILIANDFRFFDKKFKSVNRRLVLKIPFPPFDKVAIKNYLLKKFVKSNKNRKFIEDMVNLVAVKIGNKKPDIRKSLVLCQELIKKQNQPDEIVREVRLPELARKILNLVVSNFENEVWISETEIINLINSANKKDSQLSTTSIKENLEALCNLGKMLYKTEKTRICYKCNHN